MTKVRVPLKHLKLIFWALAIIYGLYLLLSLNYTTRLSYAGCRIRNVAHLLPSLTVKKPRICNGGKPALVASTHSSIYIVEDAKKFYRTSAAENISCCYVPFYRKIPYADQDDLQFTFPKFCVVFENAVDIAYEFIRVLCANDGGNVYNDFFSFVPKLDNKTTNNDNYGRSNVLNVLIVGVNAVSRVNLHQHMPKTVKYLQQIQAVEFFGYNQLSAEIFPNLIPLLTGMTTKELSEICWLSVPEKRFDECPFIFKEYMDLGVKTAFGEDSSSLEIFHFNHNQGFINQLTDYYWSYFMRVADNVIANNKKKVVYHCTGPRETYKVLLDYIDRFIHRMSLHSSPFFGFFWESTLNHDYPELYLGDEEFEMFFKKLSYNGILNSTAVIFMSDYAKWSGKVPFLFVHLPDWFKNKYSFEYDNLVTNSKLLTTAFDLHATLRHFLALETEAGAGATNGRAISLLNVIPEDRICAEIGIEEQFCACE